MDDTTKSKGYFIPPRPQIAIDPTEHGDVRISIWAMDEGDGQVHHEFTLPIDAAKDFMRGLDYVIKTLEEAQDF